MATSKAIRDRIYNILNDMTAVSGTAKTVAKHIPHAMADYEGYVFRVRMQVATSAKQSYEIRNESPQWLIELFSPSINIGFYDEKEDDMYDYRDAVYSEFHNNTILEYSGAGLVGINKAIIRDDRFTWGDTEFGLRYKWQCTLVMENKQSCRS